MTTASTESAVSGTTSGSHRGAAASAKTPPRAMEAHEARRRTGMKVGRSHKLHCQQRGWGEGDLLRPRRVHART